MIVGVENPSTSQGGAENRPADSGGVPPERRPPLTGDGGCLLGALLLLVGGGMWAFWFLFMSWSHNMNYQKESLVQFGGAVCAIAGAIILARWWAASRPANPQK